MIMQGCVSKAAAVVMGLMALRAEAVTWNLQHGNSLVSIVDDAFYGANSWQVGGSIEDQIGGQSFWYRVGSTSGEEPLGGYFGSGNLLLQNAFQATSNSLVTTYAASQPQAFSVAASYLLTDGASGTSQLQSVLVISNLSASALDMHFFQYSMFHLNGLSVDDDTAAMFGSDAYQSDSTRFAFTAPSLAPTHAEVNDFNSLLFDEFMDGGPTTLNDITAPYGSNKVAFAYQWDLNIASGGSQTITISQTLGIVPEPSTAVFFAVGAAALLFGRRRKLLFGRPR